MEQTCAASNQEEEGSDGDEPPLASSFSESIPVWVARYSGLAREYQEAGLWRPGGEA